MDEMMRTEKITPKMAERYLNSNNQNRKLRAGVVEKYAEDMRRGRWTKCPVPIVFDVDGDIADGQHRLFAIVEADTPVEFYVMRGLEKAARLNIDTGVSRSLVDNGRISGLDPNLSNALQALAIFYRNGKHDYKVLSNSAKLDVINQYRDQCEWAIHHGPTGKGFRNRVTLASIARARSFGEDEERLIHFGKVLSSGFGDGSQDSAAIAMRNYMIARQLRFANAELGDLFLKMQNAIHYFARRKPLNVIRTVKDEFYPLKKARRAA